MLKQFKTLTLCASLLCSGSVFADASDALKGYLSGLESFTAKFEQKVYDQKQLLQESKGTFAIARPNKLRWHATMPDEELLISDGKALWLYNPFLEQVSVYDLQQAIAQSPFMLLTSDDEAIWQEYRIEQLADGFKIIPKEVTNIAWLQLQLDGKVLKSLVMMDSQGKRSDFALSDFVPGAKLAAESFVFKAPEGVDIDDQRQAH